MRKTFTLLTTLKTARALLPKIKIHNIYNLNHNNSNHANNYNYTCRHATLKNEQFEDAPKMKNEQLQDHMFLTFFQKYGIARCLNLLGGVAFSLHLSLWAVLALEGLPFPSFCGYGSCFSLLRGAALSFLILGGCCCLPPPCLGWWRAFVPPSSGCCFPLPPFGGGAFSASSCGWCCSSLFPPLGGGAFHPPEGNLIKLH